MSVVKKTGENVCHSLDAQTDAGDFMTTCGEIIHKNFAIVTTESTVEPDCPGCVTPVTKPLVGPSTGRAATQYRRPKNAHREIGETLRFAHKEVVAAMEWNNRGGERQFLDNALARAALAYRFLREMLLENKRLPPDPPSEEYDE